MDLRLILVAPVMAVHEGLVEAGANFGAAALIIGVIAALWKWPVGPVVRWSRSLARFLELFRDDWVGVDDRDGVPGRPGVMAQLAEQHASWAVLRERVTKLERDLLKIRSEVTFLMSQGRPADREADR